MRVVHKYEEQYAHPSFYFNTYNIHTYIKKIGTCYNI